MADGLESALRKLTRETPSTEIGTFVLDAMGNDMPDRQVALVMASAADTMVQGALCYALTLKEPRHIFAIFYGDAPFSTFDRRIVGASALGLVGPITAANLKIIKNVRNVFAHALSDVSFESDPIARACDRLTLNDRSRFFVDQEQKRKSRFSFGHACNEVFRGVLDYCGTKWLTGDMGKRTLLDRPILP